MANIKKEQKEVLAFIDAILAMTEKVPESPSIGVEIPINPFSFLTSIILKITTKDKLIDWLANMLVVGLPVIELGVKSALLSNLKATIDCNNDPRIPDWIRRDFDDDGTASKASEKGMFVDVRAIDFKNMFKTSPLSDDGKNFYFGTNTFYTINKDEEEGNIYVTRKEAVQRCLEKNYNEKLILKHSECNSPYELVRAKDFNAFMWLVINKGYFPNGVKNIDKLNVNITSENKSLLGVIECEEECGAGEQPLYGVGNYIASGSSVSLCIESEVVNEDAPPLEDDGSDFNPYESIMQDNVNNNFGNRTYRYSIVPISSNNRSLNWYTNSGDFFQFLKPSKNRTPRDYNKEHGICNLQYFDKISVPNSGNIRNTLRFTILPKPFVHVPKGKEPIWRLKRILFNEKGEPDPKGRFSVRVDGYDVTDTTTTYTLRPTANGGGNCNLIVNIETGSYSLSNPSAKDYYLYECYPKLTVYEFNYDYVMSMQLFDPKVVARQLIDSALNLRGGINVNVNLNTSQLFYQNKLREIIEKIVAATSYGANDCFYSFDNSKYESMTRDAELKRANKFETNDGKRKLNSESLATVMNPLGKFDDNANVTTNVGYMSECLSRASRINQGSNFDGFIIQHMINSLCTILVESLLTPKVMLLFEVNRMLMGQSAFSNNKDLKQNSFDFEEVLRSMTGLITSIVIELRDLILQELINWCLDILEELLSKVKDMIVSEQLEYYSRLIQKLFKACSFSSGRKSEIPTELDVVNYADIDDATNANEENKNKLLSRDC